jgi:hypothetical protein
MRASGQDEDGSGKCENNKISMNRVLRQGFNGHHFSIPVSNRINRCGIEGSKI